MGEDEKQAAADRQRRRACRPCASPHPGTSVQRELSKAVYILYSPRLSTLTGHLTVLSLSVHPDSPPPVRTVPPGDPRSPLELTARAALDTPGTEEAPPPSQSPEPAKTRRSTRAVAPLRHPHTDSSVAREARRQKDSSAYTHTLLPDSPTPALETTRQNRTSSDPDGSVAERPCTRASPPVQDTLPSPPEKTYKVRTLSTVSLAGPDTLESLRCTGSNPDGRLTAREDLQAHSPVHQSTEPTPRSDSNRRRHLGLCECSDPGYTRPQDLFPSRRLTSHPPQHPRRYAPEYRLHARSDPGYTERPYPRVAAR